MLCNNFYTNVSSKVELGKFKSEKKIFCPEIHPKLKNRFWRACARGHVKIFFQNISRTRTSYLLKFETENKKKLFWSRNPPKIPKMDFGARVRAKFLQKCFW